MKNYGIVKDIASLLNISEELKEKYFPNDVTFNAKINPFQNKDILYRINLFLNSPSKYKFATISKFKKKDFKITSDKDYGFINSVHYCLRLHKDDEQEFKDIKEIFHFLNHSYGIEFNQRFKDEFNSMLLLKELM
jgi:hypothetical protein